MLLLLPPPTTIVTDAWRPTLAQVAAILRARTRGVASRDGSVAGEQDVFNSITRPTAAQVNECIDLAVDEMFGATGGREPCSANLSRGFRTAALYRAAMLCEISYMPEETNGTDTAFAALEKMWQDTAKVTAAAIIAQCPITSGGTDYAGEPAGRIPWRCPTAWWTQS